MDEYQRFYWYGDLDNNAACELNMVDCQWNKGIRTKLYADGTQLNFTKCFISLDNYTYEDDTYTYPAHILTASAGLTPTNLYNVIEVHNAVNINFDSCEFILRNDLDWEGTTGQFAMLLFYMLYEAEAPEQNAADPTITFDGVNTIVNQSSGAFTTDDVSCVLAFATAANEVIIPASETPPLVFTNNGNVSHNPIADGATNIAAMDGPCPAGVASERLLELVGCGMITNMGVDDSYNAINPRLTLYDHDTPVPSTFLCLALNPIGGPATIGPNSTLAWPYANTPYNPLNVINGNTTPLSSIGGPERNWLGKGPVTGPELGMFGEVSNSNEGGLLDSDLVYNVHTDPISRKSRLDFDVEPGEVE